MIVSILIALVVAGIQIRQMIIIDILKDRNKLNEKFIKEQRKLIAALEHRARLAGLSYGDEDVLEVRRLQKQAKSRGGGWNVNLN